MASACKTIPCTLRLDTRAATPAEVLGDVNLFFQTHGSLPSIVVPQQVPGDWNAPLRDMWDNVDTVLQPLGYSQSGFDARWTGEETMVGWILRAREIGYLRSDDNATLVARVLQPHGIPCLYPMSQGTYLMVPGPCAERAFAVLRADPSLRGCHFYLDPLPTDSALTVSTTGIVVVGSNHKWE